MPHGVAGGTAERRGRRVFRNEAMIFFLADGERIVEAPLSLGGGSPTRLKLSFLKASGWVLVRAVGLPQQQAVHGRLVRERDDVVVRRPFAPAALVLAEDAK